MSIADVLSDAVGTIEEYQKDGYHKLADELSVVKTLMDAMRTYLDAAPQVSLARERLRLAIREVDLSGVTAALAGSADGPECLVHADFFRRIGALTKQPETVIASEAT